MTNPDKDFRYTMPDGSEVEAYQLTPRARWDDASWPPWLQRQTAAAETNRVYKVSGDAETMYISLDMGEFALEDNAWVMKDGSGLQVFNAEGFNPASKVVPEVVKDVTPPADGYDSDEAFAPHAPNDPHLKVSATKPEGDKKPYLKPELKVLDAPEVLGADAEELTNAIGEAMAMLQKGKPDEALEFLKEGMMLRVNWCNCRPGQCAEIEVMGCRVESPLVK